MNCRLLCLLVLAFFTRVAFADEAASASSSKAANVSAVSTEPVQYSISVAEYRFEDAFDSDSSEAEILKLIRDRRISPAETIRLTTLTGVKSMVQFGRRVAVVTGTATGRGGVVRQTKNFELGTLIQIELNPHPKGVIGSINYATSRLGADRGEDMPADVVTKSTDATQIYEIGKPRLLFGSTAGEPFVVMVSVTDID